MLAQLPPAQEDINPERATTHTEMLARGVVRFRQLYQLSEIIKQSLRVQSNLSVPVRETTCYVMN